MDYSNRKFTFYKESINYFTSPCFVSALIGASVTYYLMNKSEINNKLTDMTRKMVSELNEKLNKTKNV